MGEVKINCFKWNMLIVVRHQFVKIIITIIRLVFVNWQQKFTVKNELLDDKL